MYFFTCMSIQYNLFTLVRIVVISIKIAENYSDKKVLMKKISGK